MSEINTKNLSVDLFVKNYKEMCLRLGQIEKTGNAKSSQIKTWKRFFSFEKKGNGFSIKKIYQTPLSEDDHGNKVSYLSSIKRLIMDLLSDENKKGQVTYSKYALLNLLQMVNDNYLTGKYNTKKVAKLKQFDETNVEEFFTKSSDTLTRHLEQALDSLQKNSLITYTMVKWVSEIKTKINFNESYNATVDRHTHIDEFDNEHVEYESKNSVIVEKRPTTKAEVDEIRRVERQTMIEMGFVDFQSLIRYGKWYDFKQLVSFQLLNNFNIEYYYDKYDIRFHSDHIRLEINRLNSLERNNEQNKLNESIKFRLIENTEKRAKKAQDENKVDIEFGGLNQTSLPPKAKDNYVSEHKELIETFINKGSDSIKTKLKYTKLK